MTRGRHLDLSCNKKDHFSNFQGILHKRVWCLSENGTGLRPVLLETVLRKKTMCNAQSDGALSTQNFHEDLVNITELKGIRVAQLRVVLESNQDKVRLPPFLGSTLRGGLAMALKKTVCALKASSCMDCILKERCAYSYIFETPRPADWRGRAA
jgi:hypothetical protein